MTAPTLPLAGIGDLPEPAGALVLAATPWPTNGELVLALREIGHLPLAGRILDPTYGQGFWWTRWRPEELVATDLATGVDVRHLPFPDATFAGAVYDPPHIPTRSTTASTDGSFRERYGLNTIRTSEELDELYRAGIHELARVLKPGGRLTVKTTDYVDSHRYHPMAARAVGWLHEAGFAVVDALLMLRPAGARHTHSQQNTSRRNYSTATVGRLTERTSA